MKEKSVMDKMLEAIERPLSELWGAGVPARVLYRSRYPSPHLHEIKVQAAVRTYPFFEYVYCEEVDEGERRKEEEMILELPPPHRGQMDDIIRKLVSTIHAVIDDHYSIIFHVLWQFDEMYERDKYRKEAVDYYCRSDNNLKKLLYCCVFLPP